MKIAVIRSECSFTKGGAERYAANLCRELCDMGHEVWVLAEIFDDSIHPSLKHIPIKVNRTTSSQRNRSFNENAQKEANKLNADQTIALSRSYPSDAFRVSDPLHCFWMKIRYPGKINRLLQSINPRHRTILQMERAILDPANTRMIVTNSKLSKKIIGEYYQYPQEKIHVIYNGVDHSQFTADTSLRDRDVLELLFVGQDFKRKGLAPVIDALAIVIKSGHACKLRVIGRDKPSAYVKQADELGIGEYVSFEGPTRQIQDAYRNADLFVFPSLYDPFANVVLESLACGSPVVTTTTNGSSEIITQGKNGYVIEGATNHMAKDIAGSIDDFCSLPNEQRQKMRQHAQLTGSSYTIRRNAEQFIAKLSQ
ncbi:MAG: glycosyltransferase family 4 protein [Akkermansiaceae bacterium]